MHYPVSSEDSFYPELPQQLAIAIPEFESAFDLDDGVYLLLGDFGRYIIEDVDDIILMNRIGQFISKALTHGKSETEDVIVLQVFQKIYDQPQQFLHMFRETLDSSAKGIFDQGYNDFNSSIH